MKHLITGYTAIIILTLSSTICIAGDPKQPISMVTEETGPPQSRLELCELILNRLEAVTTEPGEDHPVANFFSMIGLMLHNSSGMYLEELDRYEGLVSVDRARELISILKNQGDEQRRGQIRELYHLFGRASSNGDDFNLAAIMFSMDKLTRMINQELFFAAFRTSHARSSTERFRMRFMDVRASSSDPDKEINDISEAWSRLAPHHRAGFAEWLGRSFSEGAKSYSITTIKFTDNRPSSMSTCQMLPDLRLTLEDYLAANPGNRREMTKRYYRYMAARLLFIYGVSYSENEGTSASPALPAPQPNRLTQFLRGLLANCK